MVFCEDLQLLYYIHAQIPCMHAQEENDWFVCLSMDTKITYLEHLSYFFVPQNSRNQGQAMSATNRAFYCRPRLHATADHVKE